MKLTILATLLVSILGFVFYNYSKKSIEKEKTIVENVGIPVFKKGHENPIICKDAEEYFKATKEAHDSGQNIGIGIYAIKKNTEENAVVKKIIESPNKITWSKPIIGASEGSLKCGEKTPIIGCGEKNPNCLIGKEAIEHIVKNDQGHYNSRTNNKQ